MPADDRALVARFAAERDEAAFAALVEISKANVPAQAEAASA